MARGRRGGGFIGWILGLVVVLVLAWIGYWFGARYAAEAAINRAHERPIAGNRIACDNPTYGGFPMQVEISCSTVSLAASSGLIGELGGVQSSAALFPPGSVSADLTSPLALNDPSRGIALTVTWSQANATASAGLSGLSSYASTGFSVAMENATPGPQLPIVGASADRTDMAAAPAGNGAYRFTSRARRLAVTRTGGRVLPEADLDLVFRALDFGDSLGTDPRDAVLAWLRRGGTMEIEQARLRTSGIVVSTDGTLTISPDGVLSGALKLRFNDLNELARFIETMRPGSSNLVGPAMAALSAMTVPVETEDGPARETSLAINDGLVAIGIIPVGVLPALQF